MSFSALDLPCVNHGSNWKDILRKATWEVSEASWERYVTEYDSSLRLRARTAPPEVEISFMGPTTDAGLSDEAKADETVWEVRMNFKKRRVRTVYIILSR